MVAFIYFRKSLLLLLLFVTGTAQVCWAHAILMDSTPKSSCTVEGPEIDVNLQFNVRIDLQRSRVRLLAPDGTTLALKLASGVKPNILQTHVDSLKPGAYKLEWQVLASDGHMTRGEIPFTVS